MSRHAVKKNKLQEVKTIAINITGKVQGVFFRQCTKEKALALGITGTVCNLSDGSVQVVCTGTAEQLGSLVNWCQQGPPRASVKQVKCTDQELQLFPGFMIIR